MKHIWFILVILLVFQLENVWAEMVLTPPKISIFFEPSSTKTYSFAVLNRGEEDIDVDVLAEGELKEFVNIMGPNLTVPARGSQPVEFELQLPDDFKPGPHTLLITVAERPGDMKRGGIGTLSALSFFVDLRVPYPGDYLEIGLDTDNAVQQGSEVSVSVDLYNLGTNDLKDVAASVEFFDVSNNKSMGILDLGRIDIKSKERTALRSVYSTKGWQLGSYQAKATVKYSNKTLYGYKHFMVGDIKLEIVDLNATRYKYGQINKFDVGVQSKWNLVIEDVYLVVSTKNSNGVKAESKSAITKINAWEKTYIPVFLDTSSFEVGVYELNTTLYYLNKRVTKTFDIEIYKSFFDDFLGLQGILIIIILVLVVLLIINFTRGRRRIKVKGRK